MKAFSSATPKKEVSLAARRKIKRNYKILSSGCNSLGRPSKCPASMSDFSIGRFPAFQTMPFAKCSLLCVSIT